MNAYVLWFNEIDRTKLKLAGGKGANLGELSRIKGIQVPEGFCVTTEAYQAMTRDNQELDRLLDELTHLKAEERERISGIGAKIRLAIERTPTPGDIAEEIVGALAKLGEQGAFAVRSSATAEDLPTASFAEPSNGAWRMMHSISSRAGRSRRCSRSPKRMIRRITSTSLSVISR